MTRVGRSGPRVAVLGAGMTGLAAGLAGRVPTYEAADGPGGICASYYVRPGEGARQPCAPGDGDAYRFEVGGGHWIHSGDPVLLRFIRSLAPVQTYTRRSAVYFADQGLFVPYPLQTHLRWLGQELAATALREILSAATSAGQPVVTMADWLRSSFGPTLCELFFEPFHALYTAGLWTRIGPQDAYKTPVDPSLAIQGALVDTPPSGYNVTFVYPVDGLDALARRMAALGDVRYGKRVVHLDAVRHEVHFADGSGLGYDTLISTLPLNQMIEMTGLPVEARPDPYTSVLVLNIGAVRGARCPKEHWLYIPRSQGGFHRVGFYSNVDPSFLPASAREAQDRASIYVERAYPGGQRPGAPAVEALGRAVVRELQEWDWIEDVDVVDPTWIDVAYTWSWPGSTWREEALRRLEAHDIYQVGRYAGWRSGMSQGIAHSLRDGLVAGAALGRTDGGVARSQPSHWPSVARGG